MSHRSQPRGQILVLFALGLVAMFAMAGLLYDGAHALVIRRQLQDAGDAGALAAANVLQAGTPRGCSATAGPPPGAARPEIKAAAVAAVQANIPGLPASKIRVTCPAGGENSTVLVELETRSPVYFGGVVGFRGFKVATASEAINGQAASSKFSIIELDPYNAAWPNGRTGCPSLLISGGPTITLEGSVMLDSACPAVKGGPLGTNGNAATITFKNSAAIKMVGAYKPSTLSISPLPVGGQPYLKDPLGGLPPVPVSSLPVRKSGKTTLNSGATVLEPGVYVGGIQMKNSAKAYLRPGIYVMKGGGFDIGAQNAVYSIAATKSSTTESTWAADCPATTCGVLIFNTNLTASTDQFTVGAGATLRLRPYLPTADGTGLNAVEYQNLLLWQVATPVPTSPYAQPVVYLNGGGSVTLSGTIYAPSALVHLGGGSGGSGGTATALTLQFISWDLEIQGNSSFTFYYRSEAFARLTDYGLIR